MKYQVEYNEKGFGPKVITRGSKPLLIYMYNLEGGKKTEIEYMPLPANHYSQFSRQWFTEWRVEILEWVNGETQLVFADDFIPTNKSTHFHLGEGNIDEHLEYSKACLEYNKKWGVDNFLIETPFYNELSNYYNIGNFVDLISVPGDCYVNYVIEKRPSTGNAFENYNVPLVNEEIVFYNHNHPTSPEGLSPYEFAKTILFGPDYKTMNKFIPYDWSLQKRNVY